MKPIGTYEGWILFYDLAKDEFSATKGKKTRKGSYISHLRSEVDKANAAEKRAKVRVEPCEFTLWDDEKQTEMRVEITSYTAKGLGVRPKSGGEVFYLSLGGYGGSWGSERRDTLPVIQDGTKTQRLHQAVEGLRRAQEELRQARKALVVDVKVIRVTGDYHERYSEEEDRLRKEVNKLNGPVIL